MLFFFELVYAAWFYTNAVCELNKSVGMDVLMFYKSSENRKSTWNAQQEHVFACVKTKRIMSVMNRKHCLSIHVTANNE